MENKLAAQVEGMEELGFYLWTGLAGGRGLAAARERPAILRISFIPLPN